MPDIAIRTTFIVGFPNETEEDFQDTLSRCRKATPETIKNEAWKVKITGFLAKVAAPLL